ncbi:MAG: hypothetical protein ACKO24_14745 [Leptolyngbyaceae cyanobacterium]
MKSLEFPFLDLFQALQQAGMKLSLEQYDLLRQALGQGFGLENWEGKDWDDLRQTCRVLWVKPHLNYDAQVFEDAFNRYVQKKQQEIRAQKRSQQPLPPAIPPPQPPARQLPRVPPRKMPLSQPPPEQQQVPIAVKTGLPSLPEVDETGLHLTPTDLPLSTRTVLDSWRFLRRPLRESTRYELDLEATIDRISREGYFSDVALRPLLSKRAELIVLVDDSNVMLPFRPALQPLVAAIAARQLTPATLYRFTTYPEDYLYNWQAPTKAIPLDPVLSRLHPRRSIVMIWGDAGATQTTTLADHRRGLITFLTRLTPCLRSIIWLNPLPPHRWPGTLAQEIAHLLDGRMIHLDTPQLLRLAKLPVTRDRFFLRASG